MKRIGNKQKCPACGSYLDSEAYRCPKCRVYFCYKCRVKISKKEKQYQCNNQSCDYYGKLVCSNCTTTIQNNKNAELINWKLAIFFAVLITIPLMFLVGWEGIFITFFLLYIPIEKAMMKGSIKKRKTYRICINCKQPVKKL